MSNYLTDGFATYKETPEGRVCVTNPLTELRGLEKQLAEKDAEIERLKEVPKEILRDIAEHLSGESEVREGFIFFDDLEKIFQKHGISLDEKGE